MGMGLSIARTIIEAHKGRYRQKIGITAARRLGSGFLSFDGWCSVLSAVRFRY